MLNYKRYKRVPVLDYPQRQWPGKEITKAPIWCSVDLRDGNQALIEPMIVEEKIEFFKLLVKLGFKEIEVGFPSASQLEFDFLRQLVDRKLIPDDVTVQVLVQCREHLLKRTFEALEGVKKAIVHIYNSTSVLQRDVVFHMDKEEIKQIAMEGTKLVKEYSKQFPGKLMLEYSPESFTGTEVEYALEVCTAVQDIWEPTKENPIIFNLPSTVEMNTPNVYADQIEYMHRNFKNREAVILSVHPHNDRGTGVACAELALLAGADRIEGTLFGNGERTGNVDIITLALNMYTHGVDPLLDFVNMPQIIKLYESVTEMKVYDRQPYAGKFVFAAFSGSHQDAISKGMKYHKDNNLDTWNIPYLPLDPHDVSREYSADVIRINSQSGKGGICYILETNYGLDIPAKMRETVGYLVKHVSDVNHKELSPTEVKSIFMDNFVNLNSPLNLLEYHFIKENNTFKVMISTEFNGAKKDFLSSGSGRLDAVSNAIRACYSLDYELTNYSEHSLESSSKSQAAAYVSIKTANGEYWGTGIDDDIICASIHALISAINNSLK